MTQSAYGIQMNKALKELSDRFKTSHLEDTNPVNGQPPPYVNEYVSRVSAALNIAQSNGPDEIIDVQFDYRNSVLYIINCVTKQFPDYMIKPHPCLTPMSIIGYSLALLYALGLLNDDENIRSERSVYAKAFANDRLLGPVMNELRNLHVPPFMEQLLTSTTRSTDDRKQNLKFVYSLACFDYTHDFGRCFPINIFFLAHHFIATRQSNADITQTLNLWLTTQVMARPQGYNVAQYFGMDPNNVNETNWLSLVVLQAFNPTTTRLLTARPTLNQMNISPQRFDGINVDNLNPYMHLLCLDPQNIKEIRKILASISTAVKDIYPSAKTLTEIQQTEPNQQLLNHYYQGIIAPTCHTIPTPNVQTTSSTATIQSKVKFLTRQTFDPKLKFTQPKIETLLRPCLYRSTNDNYDEKKDPIEFIELNPFYPPIDNIRHFLPNDTKPQAIFQNIISGKMIETGELDSVAVPHINPHNSVIKENSFFLESAIPITRISPIIPGENLAIHQVARTVHDPTAPAVRMDLLQREIDRIPIFGPRIAAHIDTTIPGYTTKYNLPHTQFACNSIGYKIDTLTNTMTHGSETR